MDLTALRKKLPGEIILVTKFGSHLYGTNTPDSDEDYKGIYMPSTRDIALGKIPKSINLNSNKTNEKNSSDDVDIEMYSLHYFIELCCKGETVALDMLHVDGPMTLMESPLWVEIQQQRELFYTKNLKAFVGYARKQAAKYGIKGSRLDAAKEFIDLCQKYATGPDVRLSAIWNVLPISEHSYMMDPAASNCCKQYQICGKILQSTMKVEYAKDIIQKFYDNYGARAKLASENKGVDWKAMSHAVRAALQLKQLYLENQISFPLEEAELLTHIKMGNLPFDNVIAHLEALIECVENLAEESTFPEEVNRIYWEDFIYSKVWGWFMEVDFYSQRH